MVSGPKSPQKRTWLPNTNTTPDVRRDLIRLHFSGVINVPVDVSAHAR